MICKRSCIRRMGVCAACLVLIINLVCTSYTRVEAAPVAGYAIEEVVAALLASLGITGATGEALNKAGLTPESARTILNSIYASAKEFSHDTDEAIDQTIMGAIADATELGKIVFKQGSKAWDALKEWAKGVCTDIKGLAKPDTDEALANYYDLSSLYNYPYTEFYQYVGDAVKDMYAKVGINTPPNQLNDHNASFGHSLAKYYLLFTTCLVSSGVTSYKVHGMCFSDYQSFINMPEWLTANMSAVDSYTYFDKTVWDFYASLDGAYYDHARHCSGKVVDIHLMNMSEAQIYQKYHVGDLAMSDAYQTVYNPAIPDTTDIVTPSNTITREKDGSIAVTGDRAIDVALPIAWPVDLTKGIVIGRDIPIENVLDSTKTDEKTDEKTDGKEDTEKPATPEIPGIVADDLTADLKSIFPFCIPFDLINCIKGLSAEGEAPKWVMKIPMPTGYTWTITVDMADYDSVVRIFRLGEDLLFIVGLIMITRSLMIRG